MAALCQAMEAKDLYTRGHSNRVWRGAVMIGREISMRARRVRYENLRDETAARAYRWRGPRSCSL
jgi:HD-GYP domain-containing protein (c-di-GMP phosphodiesterase class II)